MPKKKKVEVKVKVLDLIKILEKEVRKIDNLGDDFRCLIDVLKGLEKPDHVLFSIPSERADDGTDPCCGMCHETKTKKAL